MLTYTVLLSVVSLLPVFMGDCHGIYAIGTVVLNAWFFINVFALYKDASNSSAFKVFKNSIMYLMLLFVVMLLDHYLKISFF